MIEIEGIWYKELFIKGLTIEDIKSKYITETSEIITYTLPLIYNDIIRLFYNRQYVNENHITESIFVLRKDNVVKITKTDSSTSTTSIAYSINNTMPPDGVPISFEHCMLFQRCPWEDDKWYYYELNKEVSL